MKALANALVCSRLDYCNSLFSGINGKELTRLQRIQNCLARVVSGAPRFSRSFPILKTLHWLPIESRILFKTCLLTFKALTLNQPAYLRQLLTVRQSGRNLRSDNHIQSSLCSEMFFKIRITVILCSCPCGMEQSPP